MEGTGPRISRIASRYGAGPAPPAPVFDGPVRKWKRKWVPSEPNKDNAAGGKRSHQKQQQNTPTVLLCRWTPLNNSGDSSEPSKRKFRYTPVIVLEEKKKADVKKLNDEAAARQMNQSRTTVKMRMNLPSFDDDFCDKMKESSDSQTYAENLDLQL